MAKAMKNISGNLSSKKSVDISKFSNLAEQVQKPKSPSAPTQDGGFSSGKGFNLGTVTTPYGGNTKYEATHPGIDIANEIGTKIPSFTQGKVTEIVRGQGQGSPGYGNYIIVTDPQGNRHRYSHLNKEFVTVGQEVKRGSVLGDMGNTGQTYSVSGGTGSHLDYRIKDMYNKYVNPLTFINN
jgi:murein DD-endopeptidase MepM/ murein hydrolase activator NlpD